MLFCGSLLINSEIFLEASAHKKDLSSNDNSSVLGNASSLENQDLQKDDNCEVCTICWQPLANGQDLIAMKTCLIAHFFHFNCLDNWDKITNHSTSNSTPCPNCKIPFTPADIIKYPPNFGITHLHIATYNNSLKEALSNINNVNAAALHGITPLLIAADMGNFELVRLLIEHGANPNATTHDMTTLDWAIVHKYSKKIHDYLIQNKAEHSNNFIRQACQIFNVPYTKENIELLKTF